MTSMLRFSRRISISRRLFNKNPLIHENGLYYGKFTEEEYQKAKNYVVSQYENLEKEIKGSHNIRENVGKMPQFPAQGPASKISNLSDLFSETIKTTGPIPVSTFMRQCLTHPDFGYYTTRDPLDTLNGDFVTSPEISSVFGEMIGIWLYSLWVSQNMPKKVRIIEFGPGRGTLMHDVMGVFTKFAKKAPVPIDIEIVLIEASSVLRKVQHQLMCRTEPFNTDSNGFNFSQTKWGTRVTWVDLEKDVANDPSVANYVLAHEFFDALPIKSFMKTKDGWRELMVEHTLSVVNTQPKLESAEPAIETEDLKTDFHLTISPKETPSSKIPQLSPRYRDLPQGTRIEICPDAELYLTRICELVNSYKDGKTGAGGGLIIDYGLSNEIPSNSLRGIHKHKFVSPFFNPGNVDLSIDVDFENLRLMAANFLEPFGPADQGDWLHEIGIGYRIEQLINATNSIANKEQIYESYLRLTGKDDESMGKVYKFLGLLPKGLNKPIGFGLNE